MMLEKAILLNYKEVMRQILVTIALIAGMMCFLCSSRTMAGRGLAAAFFLAVLVVYGWGIYILSYKTIFKEEAVLHIILPVNRRDTLLGKTIVASLWGMVIGLSAWIGKIAAFWTMKSEDEFDSSGTVIYYFQMLAAKLAACGMSKWEMTLTIGLIPLFLLNFAAAAYLFLSCIASFCYTRPYTKNPLIKGVVYGLSTIIICAAAYGGYLLAANSFPKILLCQGIILVIAVYAYNTAKRT